MENLFWIFAVIVVAGAVIWYLRGKKKGPASMKEPKGPTPSSPPPPPEMPTM